MTKAEFRKYFEEMDLNNKQIDKRVEHSEKLSPILFFIINLVVVYVEYGYTDFTDVVEELRSRYIELLGEESVDVDEQITDYVEKFSKEFVDTTVKHAKDNTSKIDELNNLQTTTETTNKKKPVIPEYEYYEEETEEEVEDKDEEDKFNWLLGFYLSMDRADVVAENEANVIFNHEEYKEAVSDGRTLKVWITEEDERVRETHKAVNEKAIPIDEYFIVGDSYMLYPKDTSMGASMNEIANCRCHIEYI